MSTSFTLMSDPIDECEIALRFWGGDDNGCTVRFTFPEVLFVHLKDVEILGCNGESKTIQELFNQAKTADFLTEDNSARDHLAFGTHGSREQARIAWEAR